MSSIGRPSLPYADRAAHIDRAALEQALRDRLGDAVRFDDGHRAAYASDASNYRQVPIGVVVPRNLADAEAAVAICHAYGAPILPRGGGTSQNGQCVNVAVVLDFTRYCNAIVAIDPVGRSAVTEPGVVCDSLRDAAEVHGLTFGPDPATHSRCTIAGMVGNNSCGAHSVMAGKTAENVEALEVLTYDGTRFWVGPTTDAELEKIIEAGDRKGEIYAQLKSLRDRYAEQIRLRFPDIKRRVSGYNLDQLLPENGFNVARALVGTEGTCAVTLQARLRLVHSPAERVLLVLGFPDIFLAADAVSEYSRFEPIAIEGLDQSIIDGLHQRGLRAEEIALLPPGHAWVVLEFGADTTDQALSRAELAAAHFRQRTGAVPVSTLLVPDKATQQRIWLIRETGASATALSIEPGMPDPLVGWEDAAVDPHQLGAYLREFQAMVDRFGYKTSLYGHFGDGCVHARITFDVRSAQGITVWRRFLAEAAELVVRYGGSLSGEHGDGQAKAEFLPIMYGPELMQAMAEFKAIWDPSSHMNPGKVVHAYRADENLRTGPLYKVVQLHTRLQFATPEGDGMQRQVERCIGMGRCRSLTGSTMCPSYRATREETCSTRGRAHLLWEMLQGEVIDDGWRNEAVKKALDTCLACKGCRSECPTHVDMASYKAEFLSHYHEHVRRPVQAISMGRIGMWAPWASRLAPLLNAGQCLPGVAALAKYVVGIASARDLPRFASRTFRQRFLSRRGKAKGNDGPPRPKVLLWVDTFSNHMHPGIADAAVKVLEYAGFDVVLPAKRLCCGRPLYDFGLLDQAKKQLAEILDVLAPEIEAGVPLVGLEPGCLSVFKDELLKLFPQHPLASQLSGNTFLLPDFLAAQELSWPQLGGKVMVHGHCHQKSIFGMNATMRLLQAMGMDAELIDSGCCGMAGGFGFHKDHYALSQQVGELALLPAVRASAPDTIILSDGYSCREQIHQSTDRQAMHLAELMARSLSLTHPTET